MLKATFRQLQMFALVVETGSFSAAATRLGISPAGISDQIRALERRIDCELFDRRPGTTPVLNKQGELFLRQANHLLQEAAKTAELVGADPKQPKTARLVADEYILERLLRPALPKFQLKFPNTQIEFLQHNLASDALHTLRAGKADLVYITLWSLDLDWPIDVIRTVQMGLFVSPHHPAAKTWHHDQRQKLPVISPIAGSGMELLMNRAMIQAGVPHFEAVAHTQYGETMSALAREGVGACYVMREAVAREVDAHELVELDVSMSEVYRCVLRRPGALETEHLRAVDEFAISLIRGEPEQHGHGPSAKRLVGDASEPSI